MCRSPLFVGEINMRFWIRGPRIFGARVGVSFGAEDFASRGSRQSSPSGGSFLYVITGDHERVKVGVSIDPNRRLAELQTGSPFPLRLAYVAVTPGTGYDIEAEAKRTLNRYRCVQGSGDEWFNVPVEMAVAALSGAAFKRAQPLVPMTQEVLDQTLRIMQLPLAQQRRFLKTGSTELPRFVWPAAPWPRFVTPLFVGALCAWSVYLMARSDSSAAVGLAFCEMWPYTLWLVIRYFRGQRAKACIPAPVQPSPPATVA
jgi:hypothetical protein